MSKIEQVMGAVVKIQEVAVKVYGKVTMAPIKASVDHVKLFGEAVKTTNQKRK